MNGMSYKSGLAGYRVAVQPILQSSV